MKPRLLVIECWGLGDLILATPFLRRASEQFEVTLVAKNYAAELRPRFWPEVEVLPFAAPWTAFRQKYYLWQWPWGRLLGLVGQLRRRGFAVGLSARWDPRDHALLWLAGARRRLGFPRAGSSRLLNEALPHPGPTTHQYEFWRRMGGALELPMPSRAEALPARPPGPGDVLIHSGAAQPVRVWPLARYQRLARSLRAAGHSVRVACDPGQRLWWEVAGERDALIPRDVSGMLAALDTAACFIGNDSGPGHLAAACGVPTLTLFGPQLPARFAPVHRESEWMEGWDCPHRPCQDYCRLAQPYCLLELGEAEATRRAHDFVTRHVASPGAQASPWEGQAGSRSVPRDVRSPTPRRVLCVSQTAELYGAGRRLWRLVAAVDRTRFLPLVVLPGDGPLRGILEAEGLEVLLLPGLVGAAGEPIPGRAQAPDRAAGVGPVLRLKRLIRQRQIALVHSNSGLLLAPALAAQRCRVPLVWHLRECWPEGATTAAAWRQWHRKLAARILAPSRAVGRPYDTSGKVSIIPDAFECAEGAIASSALRAESRARYGLGDDFVVGAVGRLDPERKGLDVLLSAIARLRREGTPAKALLVGAPWPGSEVHTEHLTRRAQELGLADAVTLTGAMTDPRPAYAAMDALALPSLDAEPFGGVLSEAMSLGLPAVATQHGGALDQVLAGETGLLVPPGDEPALAEALALLAGDPDLRARLGEAGRAHVRSHFSAQSAAAAVMECWDQVCARAEASASAR